MQQALEVLKTLGYLKDKTLTRAESAISDGGRDGYNRFLRRHTPGNVYIANVTRLC